MRKQGKNTSGPWGLCDECDNGDISMGSYLTTDVHIARFEAVDVSQEECEANAVLSVAACNACMRVNPSNPVAAAEAYVGLLDACEATTQQINDLLATIRDKGIEDQFVDDSINIMQESDDAVMVARAAIANAKRGAGQ